MKAVTRQRTKSLSLFLAIVMLVSMLTVPASAAGTSLTLDETTISLSESGQKFTATLTVPASRVRGDAQEWASGLTWTLDRTSSHHDPDWFPYIYTGDELKNWQTWGTDGTDGTSYFKVDAPTVTTADGNVTVTQTFTTGTFRVNDKGENFYFGVNGTPYTGPSSFVGTYQLSAKSGRTSLASTPMEVAFYDSYRPYAKLYNELTGIQALAKENGRYMEIIPYGTSTAGYDQFYVVLSDSKASVDSFKATNATAEKNPASLQAQIKDGKLGGKDYRVPFLLNNVHPNEDPGVDSQVNVLRSLATEDTLTYYTLTGLKSGKAVDTSMFDPKVAAIDGFTGLGSRRISGSASNGNNDGVTDAGEYYTMSDAINVDVEELLDNVIFLATLNENPDGRSNNVRRNANGFDLNRDASNQTQVETSNIYPVVNEWNPVVFAELHGYMEEFLVEPCTPPHEPNMEYDILVENFVRGAEAFGRAALATMSVKDEFDIKFQSYYTPLRDDFTPGKGWSAWDDLCTNYGPSYAMLNCGAMGFTIEIPNCNEPSTRMLEYGMYGLLDYVMQHKDDIYTKQLEFFRRGVENEDHRKDMERWYVDMSNNTLTADTWRVPYAENNNYFPEYYVIPVDAASQRDPADAWAMGEFLNHNGVEVRALTGDVTVGDVTYKAGSLVVDMHQAKRNYANTVLWHGADASSSGFPSLYSESVSNFPEMRGFNCVPVAVKDAFKGKLSAVRTSFDGASQKTGSGSAVVLSNNGNDAVQAVNELLRGGKTVGMITEGEYKGDFLVSSRSFSSVSNKYTLVGTSVTELPTASAIRRPTVFLAGGYDLFSGYQVTSGYFARWFSKGYGAKNYRNMMSNANYTQDVFAFENQLGFTITDDPAKADVIIGSSALNQGETGDDAVKAVKAGTPYIAMSSTPLAFIKEALLTDLDYATLGMEALHTVEYPADSIVTASQAADRDNVIYTYRCGVVTKVPEGAEVLIRAADKDSFLAGCCLNEDNTPIDGCVEAFAVERNGMDLTVFANSINNRAHQQDDYLFATNAIYAKCLQDNTLTQGML